MSQLSISTIQDTLLGWLEEQRPVLETVVNYYNVGRRITLLFGRYRVIPAQSLPSIEVAALSDATDWRFTRVQGEVTSLEVDVTVDIRQVELGNRCLNDLASVVTAVLASPPHLQGHITGTPDYLLKSLPSGTSYETIADGTQRVARISWSGDRLIYLMNSLFAPPLQVPQPLDYPIN